MAFRRDEQIGVTSKHLMGLLEPDSFWELVENLLLHSCRDNVRRQRHNAAISTLCRGHALVCVTKEAKSPTPPAKKINGGKSEEHLRKGRHFQPVVSRRASEHFWRSGRTKKSKHRAKAEAEVNNPMEDETAKTAKADKTPNDKHTENGQSAKLYSRATRSECSVNDQDVIFLNNASVPPSERLWRFAIKNRKKQQDLKDEQAQSTSQTHIPSVRSNEAIFEGLKHRLKDARNELIQDKGPSKARKKKKKSSERQMKAHKYKSEYHSVKSKTRHMETCDTKKANEANTSKKSTQLDEAKDNSHATTVQTEMEPKSKETQHDICNKQVQDLIDISESKNDWKPGSIPMVTFEEKKSMYDSVQKKRLNCGSRLETLSKEIGKKNPRTTLSRETTMKYAELKTEYLKFCYQEAALRHQIAILQAEIYMMQNKGFHKRPATIKTITLDSKSTNLPVRQEMTSEVSRVTEFDHVPLLPRLKPPKPLLLLPSPNSDKTSEKTKPKRESRRIGSLSSSEADVMLLLPSLTGTPALRGICSVYNLTTELEPPLKKRQPDVLLKPATPGVKIVHRLPKMCRILQL